MKKYLKIALLASMLPFGAYASDGMSPWYIGGGIGVNNYEPNCDLKTMKTCGEDDPYAWDVSAGYLFNDYIGAQLGYTNLGRAEWTDYTNTENDAGARGTTLGLVGFLPFANNWSLSAEAGAMWYLLSNKRDYGANYYSDNGTAPYFGAGIGYNFTDNLKIAAKYRRYQDLDDSKWNTLDMESNYWGLELSYRFGTPVEVIEEVVVIIGDADQDGVPDDIDQCPDTPMTHKVDSVGCTIYQNVEVTKNLESLRFANNSAVIDEASLRSVEELAAYMNEKPGSTVVINGYASDLGTAEYNMGLSDRRANAVAKLLVDKFGISADRVTSVGHGITQQFMEGRSAEALAANRRVEATATLMEKEPVLR